MQTYEEVQFRMGQINAKLGMNGDSDKGVIVLPLLAITLRVFAINEAVCGIRENPPIGTKAQLEIHLGELGLLLCAYANLSGIALPVHAVPSGAPCPAIDGMMTSLAGLVSAERRHLDGVLAEDMHVRERGDCLGLLVHYAQQLSRWVFSQELLTFMLRTMAEFDALYAANSGTAL